MSATVTVTDLSLSDLNINSLLMVLCVEYWSILTVSVCSHTKTDASMSSLGKGRQSNAIL